MRTHLWRLTGCRFPTRLQMRMLNDAQIHSSKWMPMHAAIHLLMLTRLCWSSSSKNQIVKPDPMRLSRLRSKHLLKCLLVQTLIDAWRCLPMRNPMYSMTDSSKLTLKPVAICLSILIQIDGSIHIANDWLNLNSKHWPMLKLKRSSIRSSKY